MAIRHIDKTQDYWLRVQLNPGPIISVPYGLKVDLIETKQNRDHFQILEGNYKGKKASVQLRGTSSYLSDKIKHGAGVLVLFDIKSQSLTVDSRGPYNAFSGGGHRGFTPVAPGAYAKRAPTVGWDDIVNALILARRSDQAIGQLVVT